MASVQECAADIVQMYENPILKLATVNFLIEYNETCTDLEICKFYMDPDTLNYFESLEYTDSPQIPEVPVIVNVDAQFVGFEDDIAWRAFEDQCEGPVAQGRVCRMNVDIDIKGTAFDLADVDIDLDAYHMPFCLKDTCSDEDLETVAEFVAKELLISELKLDSLQAELVRTFTAESLCDSFGLRNCRFIVDEVDCSGNPVPLEKITPLPPSPDSGNTDSSLKTTSASERVGCNFAVAMAVSSLLTFVL